MTPQAIPGNVLDAQDDPQLVESLRSQGFVFVDRVSGESIREVSPCRYEITQKLSNGETRHAPVEVGCLIAPTVEVSVVLLADGSFRYAYTLANSAKAEQSIYGFSIQLPASDIVTARQQGRTMALELGFEGAEVTLIAAAISEVSRNIVEYAKCGEVVLQVQNHSTRQGLCVVARDEGPGIPDVAQAMQYGYSSRKGLGVGLPGAKLLMDEFEIVSKVGQGTTITMKKWLSKGRKPQ